MTPEIEVESGMPSAPMGPGFRVKLAALVGAAAMSAASLAWLVAESGRQEEQALVEASRIATDAFVKVAASQQKLRFELDALRESTLLDTQATVRAGSIGLGEDLTTFQLSLALASADNVAARELQRLTEALSEVPASAPGLDPAASEAIRLEDQKDAEAIYSAQEEALAQAEKYGVRQESAMFGLGLIAICASLLGIAGLVGETRAGRAILGAAGAAILAALVASGSGFV